MRKSKFFLLLVVCLFIYTDSDAQRIKDKRANVSNNRLPSEPLPAEFTTYSISINPIGEALSAIGLTPKDLGDKYLTLRAFKKLPEGGHFHINAKVNPFRLISSEEKANTITTKDKNGNAKKTTQYHRTMLYQVPVTFTIEDKNGKIIEQQIYGSSAEGTSYQFLKSKKTPFNSKAELAKAWSNRKATYNKLQKEAINKAFSTFSTLIKRKYDISINETFLAIQVPTGKKVANADEFASNAEAAIKVMKAIKPNIPNDETKKNFQPMIDFWTAQKDNFSPDNKKEVKIHHACLYNLAVANLLTENFEDAEKYASLAVNTKKKKSITSSLKNLIESRHKTMKEQGVTTLYFPIDISTATAPEGVNYEKYEPKEPVIVPAKAPVDRSVKYDGYYITTSGDSLVGTYVFQRGIGEDPRFYQEKNLKFVYNKKGSPVEMNVTPHRFKRGSFNGRTFSVIKRRGSLSIKKFYYAVEVIQSGPKMKLLQIFPMEIKKDGSLPDPQTLITVSGEDGYVNVGDFKNPKFINWKKGFASLFQDCEVLYAEIRVGEYGRDLASIAEAVSVYNKGNCK